MTKEIFEQRLKAILGNAPDGIPVTDVMKVMQLSWNEMEQLRDSSGATVWKSFFSSLDGIAVSGKNGTKNLVLANSSDTNTPPPPGYLEIQVHSLAA
ncbi:MAG: hypothetical protein IJR93_05985 [Treponema sp.]|nr:hypothetical protein [Treponema sp.]